MCTAQYLHVKERRSKKSIIREKIIANWFPIRLLRNPHTLLLLYIILFIPNTLSYMEKLIIPFRFIYKLVVTRDFYRVDIRTNNQKYFWNETYMLIQLINYMWFKFHLNPYVSFCMSKKHPNIKSFKFKILV